VKTILVIKLGALGDFIHAFHAFAAIRAHHGRDRVVLLTTTPFAALAGRSPWFDDVLIDERAPWWRLGALRRTLHTIREADFTYDLQTSRRSARYFRLAGRPPWSGIAPGCSHPHADPERDRIHTIERQRGQLIAAGVTHFPLPMRDWLRGEAPPVASPYSLLIPGGAGVGSAKRWPVEHYAALAVRLAADGLTPVVIGGAAEAPLGEAITRASPDAVDLTGRTSIAGLATLGAGASLVVGNDTGPLHLAASMGAPTLVLFSAAGSFAEAGARGPAGEWASVIRRDRLADLPVAEVEAAIAALSAHQASA
jgi:ADP-heptose:LPS heptosyltransferase